MSHSGGWLHTVLHVIGHVAQHERQHGHTKNANGLSLLALGLWGASLFKKK
jgi:hypothetical protein